MKITVQITNSKIINPHELVKELISELEKLTDCERSSQQLGWCTDENDSYIAFQRDWPHPLLERGCSYEEESCNK